MSYRITQVNNMLQQEIAAILQSEIDIKDFGLISVHSVETAENLRSSKVFVTAMKHNHRLLKHLERYRSSAQKELMKRINMKPVPKIIFVLDKSVSHAARIDELIEQEEKRGKK
jgi:ribosome-binding factor A